MDPPLRLPETLLFPLVVCESTVRILRRPYGKQYLEILSADLTAYYHGLECNG